MASTFDDSESKLKRLLCRWGVWDVLQRIGLARPLAWLRRRLVPALRRQDRELQRDFRAFQKRHGRYLAAPASPAIAHPHRRVLVGSLSDWIAQVKVESIFAKALQFRDYSPVIATFRHQVRGHRYHRLFGFRNFAFLDDFIRPSERRHAARTAARFLERQPRFRDVLELEHRGIRVGRHVLSSIVSTLRSGTVEFDSPIVRDLLGRGLVEAITLAGAAERLVDRVQPELALFLERGYVPYAELFDAVINRGIAAIQYTQSHRNDAWILKRYGRDNRSMHPWSLSPASWQQVRRMPWSAELDSDLLDEIRGRYEQGQWFNRKYLQVGKKIKDADEVSRQLGLDPGKKTAVIFSHVLWDATFFYGETLFDDYEHWLVETVRAASANPAVNWVVKLHPDYVWKMKKAGDTRLPPEHRALETRIGRLPDHVKLLEPGTDISTYSLFGVTDWCITVRGTIGIEMPCFGIPVLTAGTGRYSGLGFTIDSATRAGYLDRLRNIEQIPRLTPAQVELARKHAFALFRMRPLPFVSFELAQDRLERLGHVLDHNVELRTGSRAEFAEAADLQAFARWAADTTAEDWLADPPARQCSFRRAG
jgi:hypothetical protein